jgi:hypothetical protein
MTRSHSDKAAVETTEDATEDDSSALEPSVADAKGKG